MIDPIGSASRAASGRSRLDQSCKRAARQRRRSGVPYARSGAPRGPTLRSMLASVALQASINSRRKFVPFSSRGVKDRRGNAGCSFRLAEQLEGDQPPLVTAHHLAIDQAGAREGWFQSLPLRVISRMPTGSRRAKSLNPSA